MHKMCSPDIEVRVSRIMSVAHYPGRLRGWVLQAGPSGLLDSRTWLVNLSQILERIFE